MNRIHDGSDEMTVEVEDDNAVVDDDLQERVVGMETTLLDLALDYWIVFVIFFALLAYFYQRILAPAATKWLQDRADREYEAMLHKNPDLLRTRQEALEKSRILMQQHHDAIAAKKAEERKAREEKKRQDMTDRQAKTLSSVGYKLSDSTSSHQQVNQRPHNPNARNDYNPLMGSGPSSGYRPARRSCPGGGCG